MNNIRRYQWANFISLFGDILGSLALVWWILDHEGQSHSLQFFLVPGMLARLMILPLAGPLADRFDRKKIMLMADASSFIFSFCIFNMMFFDIYNKYLLVICYMGLMSASQFFSSASLGIIADLIHKKNHIEKVMAENHSFLTLAQLLGALAGGLLVSFFGLKWSYLFNGFTFLVAMFLIQGIAIPKREKRKECLSKFSFFKDFLEGFKFIQRFPLLLYMALIMTVHQFFMAPLEIVLAHIVKIQTSMPAWYLGSLLAAIGAGAICGGYIWSHPQVRLNNFQFTFLGFILMGLSLLTLCLPFHWLYPLAAMFVFGIGEVFGSIPVRTKITFFLPPHYRSRVRSSMQTISQMAIPLSLTMSVPFMEKMGVEFMILIMGLVPVGLGFALLLYRDFKNFVEEPYHSNSKSFP